MDVVPRGVLYRDERGLILSNGEPKIIHNLEDLPEISYEGWPALRELVKGRTFNTTQFARGCYNRCKFCYLIDKKNGVRSFSFPRIERELEKVLEMEPRMIHFADDTFTYDKERAVKIGEMLRGRGVDYILQTRVNDVDPELMKSLGETGCKMAMLGIESFDEDILRKAGKNITPEQVYRAVDSCYQAGIIPRGFFIVGLPGETKRSLETTIEGIRRSKVLPRVRILMPMPGTRIYKDALRQGQIKDEISYLASFSGQERGGDTIEGDFVPVNMTENLSDQELIDARDEMNNLRQEIEDEMGLPDRI